MLASLLLGAIISLALSEVWRYFVPSQETRELGLARKELRVLQQDFDQSKRKPQFSLLLNNMAITNTSQSEFASTTGPRKIIQANLVIPTTNTEQLLTVTVRNTGNLPADKQSVAIFFPQGRNVEVGGVWKRVASVTPTTKGFSSDDLSERYYVDCEHVVDPGAYFQCDRVILKEPVTTPVVIPINIEVSALQGEKQRFSLLLIFVQGVGEPYPAEMKK